MITTLALGAQIVTNSWSLIAGGDIMLNGIKPSADTFKSLIPILYDADVAYGNLEIPLTNSRNSTNRKSSAELAARTQFILKGDPDFIPRLSTAGFNMVSLANNHALDYGPNGLQEMIDGLDKIGIFHAGAGKNRDEATQACVYTLGNGFRVGLISYLSFLTEGAMYKCTPATTTSAGVATLTVGGLSGRNEHLRIREIVRSARANCDFLYVALHMGVERQPQPKAYQVALGRLFVEEGADLVIGNHPHVLEPGELYRGRPIVYSLGNLVSPTPARSAFYKFEFDGRKFKGVSVFPTTISGGKVTVVSGKEASGRVGQMKAQEATFHRMFPSKDSSTLLAN